MLFQGDEDVVDQHDGQVDEAKRQQNEVALELLSPPPQTPIRRMRTGRPEGGMPGMNRHQPTTCEVCGYQAEHYHYGVISCKGK
jgi:hypothetical protein